MKTITKSTGSQGAVDVSVVTVSNRPFEVLRDCHRSVHAQEYDGVLEHVIVVDDVGQLEPADVAELERTSNVRVILVPRPHVDVSGHGRTHRGSVYPRLARLLNIGIANTRGLYVAFLDDDNRYEPSHIQTLQECIRQEKVRAVHSIRSMWHDGEPYLDQYFPGAINPEEGHRIYTVMCDRGVMRPGSNICADRVDELVSPGSNSTIMSEEDGVFLVDQNLWLAERSLLREIPVPEVFSGLEIENNTCPDDKLLAKFVQNQVRIVSTGLPTVRYNLGGVSNEAFVDH